MSSAAVLPTRRSAPAQERLSWVLVLPSRHTTGLVAVFLAILYAAISQNNAAVYLLGFIVFGVTAVSILHAWHNLRGLAPQLGTIAPVFEGETIVVPVRVVPSLGRVHLAVELMAGGGAPWKLAHVAYPGEARGELQQQPGTRGVYETVEVTLTSTYPLGFFLARRRCRLRQRHYVYPQPEGSLPLPQSFHLTRESTVGMHSEGQDFYGVREWRTGESMRHIDWKAVARGQRQMTKLWRGGASKRLTLSYAALSALGHETRLRQLARWILQAERLEAFYALELPHATIPYGQGEVHRHQCLRALAEFATPEGGPNS